MRCFSHGAAFLGLASLGQAQQRDIVLATTTSVRDAGLLEFLLPRFERESGRSVRVIAVGSGQAMELGRWGEVDILIVHAPEAEVEFMAQGYGSERLPLAHNEFVIVGPRGDPANVRGFTSAVAAFQAIARSRPRFVSRGDRSGTQAKELLLWKLAGVAPNPKTDAWYVESGQGMGATLTITSQRRAYTISDRATYLAQQANLDLVVLFEGDPQLLNIYHVIQVDPEKFDNLNDDGAAAFADFLVSKKGQAIIRDFGVEEFGQPLFVPDAGKSEEDLGQQ